MFFDLTSMQPEDVERPRKPPAITSTSRCSPRTSLPSSRSTTRFLSIRTSPPDKPLLLKAVNGYSGHKGQGFAAGSHQHHQSGRGRNVLHRRRGGIQRRQHRPRTLRHRRHRQIPRRRSTRRSHCSTSPEASSATASRIRPLCTPPSTPPSAPTSRSIRGLARTPGHLAAGRCNHRQPARHPATTERRCKQSRRQLQHPGSHGHALLRHRGQGLLRLQRLSPAFERIQQRHFGLLRPWLPLHRPARDGRYRRFTIKVNRPDVKIEYRPGYYAPADFKHSNNEDRERSSG